MACRTAVAVMRPRRESGRTLKIVVAACVALYFLSPGFSRMLLADSKTDLEGSVMVERSVEAAEDARRWNGMRGRSLDAVLGREKVSDDLTSDYSFPTHNRNAGDESPGQRGSRGTSRNRASQQFARYTAQYGHRHLRGV